MWDGGQDEDRVDGGHVEPGDRVYGSESGVRTMRAGHVRVTEQVTKGGQHKAIDMTKRTRKTAPDWCMEKLRPNQ